MVEFTIHLISYHNFCLELLFCINESKVTYGVAKNLNKCVLTFVVICRFKLGASVSSASRLLRLADAAS